MSGLKVKLNGVRFGDKSLPVLGADPIITEGSLILVDMSKVSGGLPANGAAIPNLVADQAKALVGADTNINIHHNVADVKFSSLQRTPKGGIYFANKPETIKNPFPNNQVRLECLGGVKDYIMNNYKMSDKSKNHKFYFSLWGEVVVPATDSSFCMSQLTNLSNHNVAKVYYMERPSKSPAGKVRLFTTPNTYGNADPTKDNMVYHLFNAGKIGINSYKIEERKAESTIFYRYYAEDLTVSGRTVDEVSAIDQELFNAAFAEGGKFHGDVYSAPSAIFV